jgi:hypothetical protein
MKPTLSKAKFITIVVLIAILHYAVFSVSYVEAEVPGAGADPATSGVIKTILSFPLGYLANVRSLAEWFPVIVALNSLLWGVACAMIVSRVVRATRLRSDAG